MTGMPSIRALQQALRGTWVYLQGYTPEEIADEDGNVGTDIRLQVHKGAWSLHTGSPDYDQDHRGFWGASWLPRSRCNTREIAKELIEQVLDDAVERV